jgi:putative FmdB family regulatory protein
MPIFEYHCDSCNQDCELLLRSRSAKPVCPHCGAKTLSKKFSSFSAQSNQSHAPAACPKSQGGSCPSGKCPFAG